MILDSNRSYSMMSDLWCVLEIAGVHERHEEKDQLVVRNIYATSCSTRFHGLAHMILKQMAQPSTPFRSLQPELLAKMPSLYESLADGLGNARAKGLFQAQKAGGTFGPVAMHMGLSHGGTPIAGWWLGVPPFIETSIWWYAGTICTCNWLQGLAIIAEVGIAVLSISVDHDLLKTIWNGETSLCEINRWASWLKKLQVEADERVAQLERQLAQKDLALAALEQEPWPFTTLRYRPPQCIRQWCVTASEDCPGEIHQFVWGVEDSFPAIGAWDHYWSSRGSRREIHRDAM